MTSALPPFPFDVSRAILRKTLADDAPMVISTTPLQEALDQQEIASDANLQVVEINGQPYGFVTRELLLLDVAQGTSNGFDYVVTFCPICNAGALFSPTIGDQRYHFNAGGIYNATAILQDLETGSFWDVINGVCLYGTSAGKRLQRLATLRHMFARDAVVAFPDITLASLPLTDEDRQGMDEEDQFRLAARPEWSSRLANTLTYDDTRLSRFEMGLGVWTAQTARYYRVLTLYAQDNMAIDTLDKRPIIVYIDPESHIPDAFYTDATGAEWIGNTLKLNNGTKVEHGTVFDLNGKRVTVERPLQLFQRWYGFAVMFRQSEIYDTR